MEPKMLVIDAADAFKVTAQALHNKLKRDKLDYKKNKNRIYFTHKTAKALFNLRFKQQIISFQIVKGGTGKTTLCLSLGIRASLYGAKILLVDLDQQGNLTKACNIKAQDIPVMIEIMNQGLPIQDSIVHVCEGVDLLPSRIENTLLDSNLMLKRLPLDRVFKDLFDPLKNEYDLILIDCPPALGSSVTAVSLVSDKIVAPVTPSEFSLEGLNITTTEIINIEKAFKTSIAVSPVLNEFDARNSLSHEILRFLITHKQYSKNFVRTAIRKCQEFENVIAEHKSIFDTLHNNTAKEDIDLLTRELLQICDFSSEKESNCMNLEGIDV